MHLSQVVVIIIIYSGPTRGNSTISVEAEMSLGKGKHLFKEKMGHM